MINKCEYVSFSPISAASSWEKTCLLHVQKQGCTPALQFCLADDQCLNRYLHINRKLQTFIYTHIQELNDKKLDINKSADLRIF